MQEKILNLTKIGTNQKKYKCRFLATNTPLQNRIVEREFAMLYGRVRAIMNYTFLREIYVKKYGQNVQKELDGILIQLRGEKKQLQENVWNHA